LEQSAICGFDVFAMRPQKRCLARNTLLQLSRISCTKESGRLFNRSDFLWAKSILTGSWEEELKRIPHWVELNSGSLAGRVFQVAPSFWIHENGFLLAEKLQWELISSNASSETTAEHRKQQAEFLGYLAKLLRSKSAFFNSKIELAAVGSLVGMSGTEEQALLEIARARLKISDNLSARKALEMLDDARKHPANHFAQNTLAQALQLIVNVLKESRGLAVKGTLMGGIVAT
jgi:hypothetical protein